MKEGYQNRYINSGGWCPFWFLAKIAIFVRAKGQEEVMKWRE
jgi:hypothetical protein